VEEEAQVDVEAHMEQEALEEQDGLLSEDDSEEEEGAGQGGGQQQQVNYKLVEFLYEVTNSILYYFCMK
jgi:hypothetical protein